MSRFLSEEDCEYLGANSDHPYWKGRMIKISSVLFTDDYAYYSCVGQSRRVGFLDAEIISKPKSIETNGIIFCTPCLATYSLTVKINRKLIVYSKEIDANYVIATYDENKLQISIEVKEELKNMGIMVVNIYPMNNGATLYFLFNEKKDEEKKDEEKKDEEKKDEEKKDEEKKDEEKEK